MRADRLLSMMLLLQSHGKLSARTLSKRLEVSTRTVMRDVAALSASGVPVYTERGPNGGIALLPDFRTGVTGLTSEESKALFVLLTDRAHADLGLAPALRSALRKVMAALPENHRGQAEATSRLVLVDPARWRGTRAPAPDALAPVQEAVFTGRRLHLRYRDGKGALTTRTTDPHGLVNKAGTWYLVASHRGAHRLFRLDRVLSATVLDQQARRSPHELADLWDQLRKRVDEAPAQLVATVAVRRPLLPRFLVFHAQDLDGDPEDLDEDRALVRLRFRAVPTATTLLSFGADVEVLDPPELRTELAARAAAVTELYRTDPPPPAS